MKPLSLSVITLLAALTASAEVVMVSGTIYDVGKGAKSVSSGVNINMDDRAGDSALCWAATASNLIQHWQDKYLPAGATAPNGLNGTNYTTPTGTRYLTLFDTFIANFKNKGGSFGVATEWYFHGKDISGGILKTGANPGAFVPRSDVSSWQYTFANTDTIDTKYQFNSMAGLRSALDNAFTKDGVGVYLSLRNTAYAGGHAISCWGYETDDKGTIVALMVTDSDDKQFGARRLAVEQKDDGKIYLATSNPLGTYNESEGTYELHAVSYITDPSATTKSANTSLSSVIATSSAVSEAVEAKGAVNVYKSISLEAGSILAASGKANNNKLSITGNGGTALDAKLGSFVNVRDTALTIRNTSGSGLHVAAEAYFDNGSVDISGVGGTGITVDLTYSDNAVYLEMDGNASVKINNNKTGGLIVKSVEENYWVKQARADISHNTAVEISGNVAAWQSGAGAQIDGILTMSDNDSVTFSGNRSTYNYEAGGGGLDVRNYNGKGNVTLSDNGVVLFENNEGNGYGGGVKASGIVNITGNDEVKFSGNKTTHASYGGGALAVTGGSGSGEVTITGNDKVVFEKNEAKANGSAILATGKKLTLSGNKEVEFTNNTGGNGSVIRNEAGSVVEIAHNDSVKFSGNDATADISNNGALYVSADKGQTIHFDAGIENGEKGVTYIGKDAAGKASTGGTYAFSNAGYTVSMQTAGATLKQNGAMYMYYGALNIEKAEMASSSFTLSDSALYLKDVALTGDLSVDLGFYGDVCTLTMNNVTMVEGSNLALSLDLEGSSPVSRFAMGDESTLTATTITLSDYLILEGNQDLAGIGLTLTVAGVLPEGSALVIDTTGFDLAEEKVTVTGYDFNRDENGKLYYSAQTSSSDPNVPEPATATLSLLALAALAARRRRHPIR